MIELPKRSITRFFVPLIDVLILLFCIFLLMPYVATPEGEDAKLGRPDGPTQAEFDTMKADLKVAQDKAKELQKKLDRPDERYLWRYLEISPIDGSLTTFIDGDRRTLKSATDAETIIRAAKTEAGEREPCFLMMFPREPSGFPEQGQVDRYREWFRAATVQIDNPLKPRPGSR